MGVLTSLQFFRHGSSLRENGDEYRINLRLDRGDAHPRVTGCTATHRAFETIEEARQYMADKEVSEYKEVIKDTALDTTPKRGSMAYYAVAHGEDPGIRNVW